MKLKASVILLLIAICCSSCSYHGARHPRHRKARNCGECPRFSMAEPQLDERTTSYTI